MRIAVLTTDTPHHRYFLRRLAAELPDQIQLVLNIFETREYPWSRLKKRHIRKSLPNLWRAFALNPYATAPELGAAQSAFEEAAFFPDGDNSLPAGLPSLSLHSVNDDQCLAAINEATPDLLLVYGTGKIYSHIFEAAPLGALNAHGGLLPGYRGLDTNLWAAYEGKPEDMAVTLHMIDAELDTGPVYETRRLGKIAGLNLANLRYHTAVICTDMFIDVVSGIAAGTMHAKTQNGDSRYFGPMPTRLKLKTEKLLQQYVAN